MAGRKEFGTGRPGAAKKIAGLERNVFYSGLVSLLMDVSSEMLYPLVPLFLSTVLGVNKAVIGAIEGIAEATAGVLKTYSGWLSDRVGRRKALMIAGYGISTLSRPVMALSAAWHHVLAARFIDRAGKGVRGAPRDALIAESSGAGELGRSFGFHRAMDTAGAALGPLIAAGILLLYAGNYRIVFWASMAPGALAVFVLARFIKEKGRPRHGAQRPRLSVKAFGFRYKAFLVVITVFSLGNSSDAFLILKAGEAGISAPLIPIVYLLFNLVYAMVSIPAGMLSDRVGSERVIFLGLVLFGLVYLGFALASAPAHVWGLFALYGVFLGLTEGVERAYVGSIVPPEFRATAYGVYHTAKGLSVLPASVAGGALWDAYGPGATFGLGSGAAFLAAGLFAAVLLIRPARRRG